MFERCLYFNINAITRRINKIWDQAFSDLDFSPAHAYLLRLVLESPAISQKSIADELKLEKSTVTRFIDNLETRGFLKRIKSGREQLIYPTASAKKLEKQLNEKGEQLYKKMLKTIGRTELTNLVEKLKESEKKLK